MKFKTLEEAITRANNTAYGLAQASAAVTSALLWQRLTTWKLVQFGSTAMITSTWLAPSVASRPVDGVVRRASTPWRTTLRSRSLCAPSTLGIPEKIQVPESEFWQP